MHIFWLQDIAVTRTIAANVANAPVPKKEKQALAEATQVAFKNCARFKDCRMEINDTFAITQILLILQCLSTI